MEEGEGITSTQGHRRRWSTMALSCTCWNGNIATALSHVPPVPATDYIQLKSRARKSFHWD
jgi:hypothetical protein